MSSRDQTSMVKHYIYFNDDLEVRGFKDKVYASNNGQVNKLFAKCELMQNVFILHFFKTNDWIYEFKTNINVWKYINVKIHITQYINI